MAWGKDKRAAKAKAKSEKSLKNLDQAAKDWNKKSDAQKKAARRWGKDK